MRLHKSHNSMHTSSGSSIKFLSVLLDCQNKSNARKSTIAADTPATTNRSGQTIYEANFENASDPWTLVIEYFARSCKWLMSRSLRRQHNVEVHCVQSL
jgi:hypothetical protein